MKTTDFKEVATQFFYHWYNTDGNNTSEGFNEWIEIQKKGIVLYLSDLELGWGKRKWVISKELKINPELLTILLKELKYEGKIKLMMIWSEETGLPDGSGYCLTNNLKD